MEFGIEMAISLLTDFVFPIVVSIICFQIQYRHTLKRETKDKIPTVYTINLTGKNKMQINKERIKGCKYVIEFSYRKYPSLDDMIPEIEGRALDFNHTSYEKVLRGIERNPMFLIGFENFKDDGLQISHLLSSNEMLDMDNEKVPVSVSKNNAWCLLCKKEDVPEVLKGTFMGKPIRYELEGKEDTVVLPIIEKENRRNAVMKGIRSVKEKINKKCNVK